MEQGEQANAGNCTPSWKKRALMAILVLVLFGGLCAAVAAFAFKVDLLEMTPPPKENDNDDSSSTRSPAAAASATATAAAAQPTAHPTAVPGPDFAAPWTIRDSAADNEWRSVTYGNGIFVAVSTTGSGNRVMTSSDGITWTSRTSAADNDWFSVTYGNGIFVAVSYTGSGNRVMTWSS